MYLCGEKNAHKLDEVTDEMGIALHSFKGEYSFLQLVSAGYPTISGLLPNAAYIAVDVDCVGDDDKDFVSALESLELINDARIILISEGGKRASLISRAAKKGFINIVSADSDEEQKAQLRMCIEGEGMTRQQAQRYIHDESEENDGKPEKKTGLTIGICGAIHRVGTTATAFQIASWLQYGGKKTCIIEANSHGHMATIAHGYEVEEEADGALNCSGLMLYPACLPAFRPKAKFDALCYDFGMLEEIRPETLAKCDVQIVCSGVKPWESYWLSLLFDCAAKMDNLSFLFSFSPPDERNDVRRLMEKYADRCYFSEYAPDLFDGQTNRGIFEQMLKRKSKVVQLFGKGAKHGE